MKKEIDNKPMQVVTDSEQLYGELKPTTQSDTQFLRRNANLS